MKTQTNVGLEAEKYYHIYNRGNNGEPIFFRPENYRYFLVKLDDYFSDFLTIHAFCLIRNHFHLLVEIKSETEIKNILIAKEEHARLRKYLNEPMDSILSKQFQYFFIAYAKAINKETGRHGSLFEKPFKRKHIATGEYYRNVMYYIHRNMNHHSLPFDYDDYSWSSYSRILESRPSKLPRERIIKAFEDKNSFSRFHEVTRDMEKYKEVLIDY
jgi:putative transposase